MGDNHYRRYVEHRRRVHPGEPVVSEREYWRMRHDASGEQSQPSLLLTPWSTLPIALSFTGNDDRPLSAF